MNWSAVLEHYDLGGDGRLTSLGGTASPKVLVHTAEGDFILRCRPAEAASPEFTAYDHALRSFLADQGFPAPRPVPTRDGRTYVELRGAVFELSESLPGGYCPDLSLAQLAETGRALARLHELGKRFRHPGKRHFVREDHISVLQPLLDELGRLPNLPLDRRELTTLEREVADVSAALDGGLYDALEQSVIHGDFHPGNVLYEADRLTAVLDYDYAAPGATLRDLGDGLMFFASTHARPVDPADIWSLAQPWRIDEKRTAAFLRGYVSVRPIPPYWPQITLLMLSRWFQVRLRGARKVALDQKVRFVFADLWPPVQLLKRHYQAWLNLIIDRL